MNRGLQVSNQLQGIEIRMNYCSYVFLLSQLMSCSSETTWWGQYCLLTSDVRLTVCAQDQSSTGKQLLSDFYACKGSYMYCTYCSCAISSLHNVMYLQHLKAAESKITLFATYPQRELSSEQDTESMSTLDLVPSAVVLAKMSKVSEVLLLDVGVS